MPRVGSRNPSRIKTCDIGDCRLRFGGVTDLNVHKRREHNLYQERTDCFKPNCEQHTGFGYANHDSLWAHIRDKHFEFYSSEYGSVKCPEPTCKKAPFTHAMQLWSHVRRRHGAMRPDIIVISSDDNSEEGSTIDRQDSGIIAPPILHTSSQNISEAQFPNQHGSLDNMLPITHQENLPFEENIICCGQMPFHTPTCPVGQLDALLLSQPFSMTERGIAGANDTSFFSPEGLVTHDNSMMGMNMPVQETLTKEQASAFMALMIQTHVDKMPDHIDDITRLFHRDEIAKFFEEVQKFFDNNFSTGITLSIDKDMIDLSLDVHKYNLEQKGQANSFYTKESLRVFLEDIIHIINT